MGKSRLVAEGLGRIVNGADAETTQGVRVLRGRCLSYGQSVSLWLIADLLRSIFALAEEEGLDAIRATIAGTVEAVLAACEPEDRSIAGDVLGEVLGLPAGGSLVGNAGAQIRRQSLVRMLRLILASLAERQPMVLVLEDLHWLDTASEEILTELLIDMPGATPSLEGTPTSSLHPRF